MPLLSVISASEGQADKNEKDRKVDSQYILPVSTPIVELDACVAFDGLTKEEKLYAHYLSKASWYGGLICLIQGSPEAPLIFSLVLKVFGGQCIDELEKAALESGVTPEEFQAVLVYVCGVLGNSANYKSYGDSKFVPDASVEVFEVIIKQSKAYKEDEAGIHALWKLTKHSIYSLSDKEKTLGFPDEAVTTYLSLNCTKTDTDLIGEYLRHCNMEAYNSRAFKTQLPSGKTSYEIRLASQEEGELVDVTRCDEEFEGAVFRVTRGDYAPLMKITADYLDLAKAHAANETEKCMVAKYVESFRTGSLDAHKDGSRFWIKDKGPVVETYIGFIETYRDPAGERAEFCGWVAVVNKERSTNFGKLVAAAETILPKMPWSKAFEKDVFLRPDFTSLDVLTFACSMVPAGINIPNYDQVRQNEGFKNVSMGNVISSSMKDDTFKFLSAEDQAVIRDYRIKSFEVQVALHELLGHGSGKLLVLGADGKFNFDEELVNPLTQKKVESWYQHNESYDSKFKNLSSTYEECRAEAVGLYLSLDPEVLAIFGYEGEEAERLVYANWLSMMWGTVAKGPEVYSTEKKAWLQAHTQARFVLLRVLQEAGEGLISVKETEPGKNLLLTLDRTKIPTVGKKAIGDFLLKLQVYKATGDIEAATAMYNHYSTVPEDSSPWINWKKIALDNSKPRRILLQANTELKDQEVVLRRYSANLKGLVQSWADRFSDKPDIHEILEKLWHKDRQHFGI